MDIEYLTPKEVARRLRVKVSTVRRWIYTGALEAETIRQGKRNRQHIKKSIVETIERRDPERHRTLV
jgi:excisionase family DNA binding protein